MRWHFPHMGQRLVKTAAAVFICLMIYAMRGHTGQDMPTEAAITAMVCMQPDLHGTRDNAFQRLTGSLIGVLWGLAFLLLMMLVPRFGSRRIVLYSIMSIGLLVSMYSAVAVRVPAASGLAGIVFLCIVITYPDIDDPLENALHRMIDILVGTGVAVLVNMIRVPRVRHTERLIFIRTKDLTPDQFTVIPSGLQYRLNSLYRDGAKISMISAHAPAFMLTWARELQVNTPMIVMDGAAVYDANENRFLYTVNMVREESSWLLERLTNSRISFFVYTIHGNRTRIFHHGEFSRAERIVYERMKRSLYRDYLDEEKYAASEIVYVKAIMPDEDAEKLRTALEEILPEHGLRCAVRTQRGVPGHCGVYFYPLNASVSRAEDFLVRMYKENGKRLTPVEVFSPDDTYSDRQADRVMNRLTNTYEPLWIRDRIQGNFDA